MQIIHETKKTTIPGDPKDLDDDEGLAAWKHPQKTNAALVYEPTVDLEYISKNTAGNLYWKDLEGRYIGCNDNFLKICGVESVKGKTDRDLFSDNMSIADLEKLEAIDQEVMRSKTIKKLEEIGIDAFKKKAYYNTEKRPLLDKNGDVIGVMGTSIDKTQEKYHEQTKDDLIANMGHDLITHLGGIFMVLEICHRAESNADSKILLGEGLGCVNEMIKYWHEMRIYSLQMHEPQDRHNVKFSIHEVLEDLFRMQDVAIRDKGLEFFQEIEDFHDEVIGDRVKFKHIFLNILSNAIKFTKEGCVTFRANIINITDNEVVTSFLVTDTGKGISKDALPKIFDKFYREDRSCEGIYTGGIGLGLFMVKKFVDDMGGSIHVSSIPGTGTAVLVTLTFGLQES